jgi:hypothetical protein
MLVTACSTSPNFVGEPSGTSSGAAPTGGGGAGAAGSGGAGPEECLAPADCGGEDTECAVRVCADGLCGKVLQPKGQVIGAQESGDCQRVVCDGQGHFVGEPDDSDLPNDSNDCTKDLCSRGTPSHENEALGTGCGFMSALSCDGAGTCTGCTQAVECGTDGGCVSFTCVNSACGTMFTPDGQGTPPGQTDHDCKKVVCNGTGGTKIVNDDVDTLPDGNACTVDLCSNGVATYSSVTPSDDGNPCTDDACDPSTGQTVHSPGNNGVSCGGCAVCSQGSCESTCGGCEYCNGSSCESGCGACEQCVGGQCQSTCGGCQQCVNGSCQGGCGACENCINGSCQSSCGACETCNGSYCESTCGSCEVCSGGACQNNCGPCQACDAGACTDTCGACESCVAGSCQSNCSPCEACVSGYCQDNCGGCSWCNGSYCEIDTCCQDPCSCYGC